MSNEVNENENWDDDFLFGDAEPPQRPSTIENPVDARFSVASSAWDAHDDDEQADDFMPKPLPDETDRTVTNHHTTRTPWVGHPLNDNYDRDFPEDNDRTEQPTPSTSAARATQTNYDQTFLQDFPPSATTSTAESPSMSTFSALSPASLLSHESGYPLIASATMVSASSPPRPRRRLRKKSRPQEYDGNTMFMEMMPRASASSDMLYRHREDDDETDVAEPLSIFQKATTPDPGPSSSRPRTPSILRATGTPIPRSPLTPAFPTNSPPSSPPRTAPKTPLLTRIGSMKRWRSRRQSGTSADLSLDTSIESINVHAPYLPPPPETPEPLTRPTSPSTPGTRTSWLFSRASTSPEQTRRDRSGSGSAQRPPSRFGARSKKSTPPAEAILAEEAERSTPNVTIVPLARAASSSTTSFDSKLQINGTGKPTVDGRRPLSLQPQPLNRNTSTIAPSSYGRSASAMSRSRESISSSGEAGSTRKSSNVLRKRTGSHRRSLSLTSDPDNGRRSPIPVTMFEDSPPPPVPPLPRGARHHKSSASASASLMPPPAPVPHLLPPISLQPPSPPETISVGTKASKILLSLSTRTPPRSKPPISGSRTSSRTFIHSSPNSGQSLSLGRGAAALLPSPSSSSSIPPSSSASDLPTSVSINSTLRRSSLGDLKIPARISMAQTGLKNNLGMLREFAIRVDDIQKLQAAHLNIIASLRACETPSTTQSGDSGLSPSVARLETQYALWWECAELLVELGGGSTSTSQPKDIVSPIVTTPVSTPKKKKLGLDNGDEEHTVRALPSALGPTNGNAIPITPRTKERERAVTRLTGERPPTESVAHEQQVQAQRRPSTSGRTDLSMRQLALLKEMLETPDPSVFDRQHSGYGNGGLRFASQPENGLHAQGQHRRQQQQTDNASAVTLPSIPPSPALLRRAADSSTSVSLSEDSTNARHPSSANGHARIKGRLSPPGNGTKNSTTGKSGASGAGKKMQRFRDMLRSLTNTSPGKREQAKSPDPGREAYSSASQLDISQIQEQRRAFSPLESKKEQRQRRKSTDPVLISVAASRAGVHLSAAPLPPASMKHIMSPYNHVASERDHRKSPRRPSLASIFRIGQSHANGVPGPVTPIGTRQSHLRKRKNKRRQDSTAPEAARSSLSEGGEDDDYSDWDRMDSASDLEDEPSSTPRRRKTHVSSTSREHGQGTIKGRHLVTPRNSSPPPPLPIPSMLLMNNGSQISIRNPSPTKPHLAGRSRSRTGGRADLPPPPPDLNGTPLARPRGSTTSGSTPPAAVTDFKLALTPDTIRPLLEYAKEVSARLNECVEQLREVQARAM